MGISEKVAYLKGLMEGMNLNADSNEGKLFLAIADVLDEIALEVEDLTDEVMELGDGLDEAFPGPFDAIVSNPPYVPQSDLAAMHANVRGYEPPEALFVPDDDALRFYRAIARAGRRMLRPGGKLYFEIYERSAGQMRLLLGEEGYTDTEVREDLNGKPRMVCSRMK